MVYWRRRYVDPVTARYEVVSPVDLLEKILNFSVCTWNCPGLLTAVGLARSGVKVRRLALLLERVGVLCVQEAHGDRAAFVHLVRRFPGVAAAFCPPPVPATGGLLFVIAPRFAERLGFIDVGADLPGRLVDLRLDVAGGVLQVVGFHLDPAFSFGESGHVLRLACQVLPPVGGPLAYFMGDFNVVSFGEGRLRFDIGTVTQGGGSLSRLLDNFTAHLIEAYQPDFTRVKWEGGRTLGR